MLFSWHGSARAAKRFTLSVVEHPIIIPTFSPPILRAYRKLGIKVELQLIKGGRGLIESTSGRTDGELVRMSAIEQYTDELLRVPVSLGVLSAKLFCDKKVLCEPEVLNDPAVIVGIINGENAMSLYMEDKHATVVAIPDLANLKRMLEKGRLSYIIGMEHDLGFKINYSPEFQVSSRSLFEGEVFHYVHRKHLALVPQLAEALEQSLLEEPIRPVDVEY